MKNYLTILHTLQSQRNKRIACRRLISNIVIAPLPVFVVVAQTAPGCWQNNRLFYFVKKHEKKPSPKLADVGISVIFRPLRGIKILQKHFYLVEEVLSFNLVGHMWKSFKNWLQEWMFYLNQWKWGWSRWLAYYEDWLQKWFQDRFKDLPELIQNIPQHFAENFPQNFLQHVPQHFP